VFTSSTFGVSIRTSAESWNPSSLSGERGWLGRIPTARECALFVEGDKVQRARFVFLAAPVPDSDPVAEGIVWILVSPNNRPLGRGTTYHETYGECRQAVLDLQANAERVMPMEMTVERTGQWTWRIDLDGATVAVSSRSYLRARECTYNLERFVAALPNADIVAGTRSARRGPRRAPATPLPRPGWNTRSAV
jgi:hypothetical protein